MTHITLAAEDDGAIRGCCVLDRRAHLACVHGVGTGVVVEGNEHRGGIRRVLGDTVVRRVAQQPVEVLGNLRIAVLHRPRGAELGRRVADHVEERGDAHDRLEEVGALGHRGADEQAAVGAALDGELR